MKAPPLFLKKQFYTNKCNEIRYYWKHILSTKPLILRQLKFSFDSLENRKRNLIVNNCKTAFHSVKKFPVCVHQETQTGIKIESNRS